jgi:hypothetical protein
MKPVDLVWAALAQIAACGLGAAAMHALGRGDFTIALVMGAVVGSQVAGFRYHRGEAEPAPFAIKARAGAALAATAVLVGSVTHLQLALFESARKAAARR